MSAGAAALGWLVLLCNGCDLSGIGRDYRPCLKSDCGGDRARLSGAVAKASDEPFHYDVRLCAEADCTTYSGTAPVSQVWYDEELFLSPGCVFNNPELGSCDDDARWFVSVAGKTTTENGDQVMTHHITIRDLDTGEVLVEREFEASYETVDPLGCSDNPDNLSCTHSDSSWD